MYHLFFDLFCHESFIDTLTFSPLWDSLQSAYRANRSVEDIVNTACTFSYSNLTAFEPMPRAQFVDLNSAFNAVITELRNTSTLLADCACSHLWWITGLPTAKTQHH